VKKGKNRLAQAKRAFGKVKGGVKNSKKKKPARGRGGEAVRRGGRDQWGGGGGDTSFALR